MEPSEKLKIDRLEAIFTEAKGKRIVLKREEFAKKLGYSRSHFFKMLQGEYEITDETMDLAEKMLIATQDVSLNTPKEASNQVKPVHYDTFMETHYIPRTSYAGYLRGHADPTFIDSLPTMLVPKEFDKGNYIVVEVQGNSMDDGSQRAIMDGDKLLIKELDKIHWKNKLFFNRNIFVIVEKNEGIVVKQIIAHDVEKGIITCHSWNSEYSDYQVKLKNVQKLFYVKKIVERKIQF